MSKTKSRKRKNLRKSRQQRSQQLSFEKLEERRVLTTLLNVDGISGSSQIVKNAIEIESFQFDVSTTLAAGKSELSFSNLNVNKDFDKSTPTLLQNSVLGKSANNASVNVFSPNTNTPQPEIRLELGNGVLVTSFGTSEEAGKGEILENVGFAYNDLLFGFRDLDNQGNFLPEQTVTHDLQTGKSGGTAEIFNTDITEGLSLTIGGQEISIDSFTWDVAAESCEYSNGNSGDASCNVPDTGIIGGESNFPTIRFSRTIDASTPAILRQLLDKTPSSEIILRNQSINSNFEEVASLQWTLENAIITDFAFDIDENDESFENSFEISFTSIKLESDQASAISFSSSSTWNTRN